MQKTDLPLYKTISSLDRWLITFVVMSATLMEVIDSTIVNVALPHMQGSLGASSDEVTWTLTSYIVATAVFMPLTGYLADKFGRKRYLVVAIILFTIASGLCGAATSLSEIVFFRLIQGVVGAGLIPLSQAILTDIFPPEERGKAMAIWGIGVMVGPILGPSLGGYLTELASWRWTFYINVPVGMFALMLSYVLPDSEQKNRRMDWKGLFLISSAIGGLQYILDRGNTDDWFSSTGICIVTYLTVTAFLGFLLHSFNSKAQPVFDLRILRDRNFTISSFILAIFCLGLYGMTVVQPFMLEAFFNYPALTTGLMLAPRGISGMISMMIVGKLITKVDARVFIITGIIINAIGMWIATNYSLNISMSWIVWPMFLQGFGLGMVFVPLSIIAYSTLPISLRVEAAGIFSLIRTIGGSIGISLIITFFSRWTQMFWNELGGSIHIYNSALINYLNPLNLQTKQPANIALISSELHRQAAMLSFVNVFAFIMWCFVLMIPLVFLLKKTEKPTSLMEVAGH